MTSITSASLETRTSPRALAALLLSAAVAAAMLVTEQWLEPWASRHQVGAWLVARYASWSAARDVTRQQRVVHMEQQGQQRQYLLLAR